MSPQLQAAALTLKEQVVLRFFYGVRWGMPPGEVGVTQRGQLYTKKGKRTRSEFYGATKELSRRVFAGEFGDASIPEIIERERARRASLGLPEIRFHELSVRNTVWKLRNEGKRKTGRRVAA